MIYRAKNIKSDTQVYCELIGESIRVPQNPELWVSCPPEMISGIKNNYEETNLTWGEVLLIENL